MKTLHTYILSLFLYSFTLFANPAPFESDPIVYVENCVNAMTGDCVLTNTDYVVPGKEPIELRRFYLSGDEVSRHGGWEFVPQDRLTLPAVLEKAGRRGRPSTFAYPKAYLKKPNGTLITYEQGEGRKYMPEGTSKARLIQVDDYTFIHEAEDGTRSTYRKAFSKDDDSLFLLYIEELPNGNVRLYDHNAEQRLEKITTSDGAHSSTIYASCCFRYFGKVKKVRDFDVSTSDGKKIFYRFHSEKKKKERQFTLASVQIQGQKERSFSYTDGMLTQFGGTVLSYDAEKRVQTIKTPNNSYQFSYHGNQQTTITHSNGSTKVVNFTSNFFPTKVDIKYPNGSLYKRIEMKWTPKGRLAQRTLFGADLKKIWSFDFDANETRFSGDLSGRGLWETIAVDGEFEPRIAANHPQNPLAHALNAKTDAFGNLIEEIAPDTYDEKGNIVSLAWRYTYDANGNLLTECTPNGFVTTHRYNARSQKTETTFPDRSTENWLYDLKGRCISFTNREGSRYEYLRDEEGQCTEESFFDADNNLLKRTEHRYRDGLLVETLGDDHITYKYDAFGHLAKKTLYFDDREVITFYSYDRDGKLLEESLNGNRNTYTYDELGRLVKIENFDDLGELIYHEGYGYDDRSNLIWNAIATDRGFPKWTREYDASGRLINLTSPEGKQTLVSYQTQTNELGQKVLQVVIEGPDGTTHVTTHDVLGRVVYEDAPEPTTYRYMIDGGYIKETRDLTTTYDKDGNPIHVLVGGDLYTSTFDAFGRRISIETPENEYVYYTYDAFGRLQNMTSSDESIHVSFTRNAHGNATEIFDAVTNTRTLRRYDSAGNLVEETLANGLAIQTQYDKRGRCVRKVLPNGSTIDFKWDGNALAEVHRECPVWELSYTHLITEYDLSGAPTQQRLPHGFGPLNYILNDDLEIAECSYRGIEHHLPTPATLDVPPYLMRDQGYSFDLLGRLTEVVQSDRKITFTYDIFNRRMSKKVFQKERGSFKETLHHLYLYDGDREIGAFDVKDGLFVELRICAPAEINPGDQAIGYEFRGNTYLPIYSTGGNIDALFSVLRHTLMESYSYDENGCHTISDQWDVVIRKSKAKNPWRFGCHRFDEETGLYFINGNNIDPTVNEPVKEILIHCSFPDCDVISS